MNGVIYCNLSNWRALRACCLSSETLVLDWVRISARGSRPSCSFKRVGVLKVWKQWLTTGGGEVLTGGDSFIGV